jgi:DNA/RNA endonuclease YhcR with UshA esterase domain
MKSIACIAFALLLAGTSQAQSPIKAADAAKHLNEKATVCDSVYSGRWLENANGQPCLLNMGGSYPSNPFTFVIFGESRVKFPYKPEEYLVNKQVCVTGEIKSYRDKPQIVVDDPKQVEVKK